MYAPRVPRAALAALALVLACKHRPPPRPHVPQVTTGTCIGDPGEQAETLRIRETTQRALAAYRIGVADIFVRDAPDKVGAMAPRLSARIALFDPTTDTSHEETVIAGSVVTVGADRYCVVGLEEANLSPGWLSLRKLP